VQPVHIPTHTDSLTTPEITNRWDEPHAGPSSWSEVSHALDRLYQLLSPAPRREPLEQFPQPPFLLCEVESGAGDVLPLPVDLGLVEPLSGE
jgi:hypothetical protein